MIDAYPLAWPVGWKRTAHPRKARYEVSLEAALTDLCGELRLMGGRNIVVSSNVPTRRDGLPRSGLSEPTDRGVAVYWDAREVKPMVVACDTWNTVRANVRAIGLTVAALRQIERTGASQLLERAFTGFAALPAQAGTTQRSWREVLGINGGPLNRDRLDEAYKRAVRTAHPDLGGSHEAMVEVNAAYRFACMEVS